MRICRLFARDTCVEWLMAVMLFMGCWSSGTIWYVRSGALGGDGTGWGKPLASLQRAIDLAAQGDAIWVAGGSYEPEHLREVEGEQVFASSFELKDGIAIYGGFRGDEATVEERPKKKGAIYGWEFASPTILRQREGALGSVLRGISSGYELGGELNGLVVEGGRALGTKEEGKGGGLYGTGKLKVVKCLFRRNLARMGGGIAWTGALDAMCVGLMDNRLVQDEWHGQGGGAMIVGEGYRLMGVVCAGNGIGRGVQDGGGLYLNGQGIVAQCTIVANQAWRHGSGIWLGKGARLVSSLIWGNGGCWAQVTTEGGTIDCCGIEGWTDGRGGNLPLLAENAGPGGIDVNDNSADGYYPCFVSPETRDYRLGKGSYALNRGRDSAPGIDALGMPVEQSCPSDMGACGSAYKGNLAIDAICDYPRLYGGTSRLQVTYGLVSPAGLRVACQADTTKTGLTEVGKGMWQACWLRAGTVCLEFRGKVVGQTSDFWNPVTLVRSFQVLPRPLMVMAMDEDYRHGEGKPRLDWVLIGGELMFKDRLMGKLTCDYAGKLGQKVPIAQGTLRVEDGQQGSNYRLVFSEGQLIYDKGLAELSVSGEKAVYDGQPVEVVFSTVPENLPMEIWYEGTGDTDYLPSRQAPTDAGTYVARVAVEHQNYEGREEFTIVITKAPLVVTAEDKTRPYGQPNPKLTMSFAGFLPGDGVGEIILPEITTVAMENSPVQEGGYPIRLSGGGSRNYRLLLHPGILTVERGTPRLGKLRAGALIRGEPLRNAILASDESATAGTFSWLCPERIPREGITAHEWQFTPMDIRNWMPMRGSLNVSVIHDEATVER